jgi:hypothetical protein
MGLSNGEVEQRVSPGGFHVAEMHRATVPDGRTGGYIQRRASAYATFGCTCGEFADGPYMEVATAFVEHINSDAFQEAPADGA